MGGSDTAFIAFSFTAGAVTFFAPCSYPLLPGYVAFYLGADETANPPIERRLRQAVMVGVLVSLGFAIVYGVLGAIVALAGTRLLSRIGILELIVGAALIGLGGRMAVGRPPLFERSIRLPKRRRTPLAFVSFGIAYAAAAAGCTAPVFFGVAGISLESGPAGAIAGFGSYALGMALLMIALTTLVALGRRAIVSRLSRNSGHIRRAAGSLLVLAGSVQVYLYVVRYGSLATL